MLDTEEPAVTTRAHSRQPGRAPDERRQARLAAVQALYQVELGEIAADTVVHEFLQHRLEEVIDGVQLGRIDRGLFGDLVKGVTQHRADLAETAGSAIAEGWTLERLETLLRIILLCGTFELAHRPQTPARAAIHEYVDLAKAFFDDREPKMVNGVLDHLAQVLRPEEMTGQGGR
jgi:N utilization substance protein B